MAGCGGGWPDAGGFIRAGSQTWRVFRAGGLRSANTDLCCRLTLVRGEVRGNGRCVGFVVSVSVC